MQGPHLVIGRLQASPVAETRPLGAAEHLVISIKYPSRLTSSPYSFCSRTYSSNSVPRRNDSKAGFVVRSPLCLLIGNSIRLHNLLTSPKLKAYFCPSSTLTILEMARRQHITLITLIGVSAIIVFFFISTFRNQAEGTRHPDYQASYNGPSGGVKIDHGILHGEATAPKIENATLK